MTAPPDDRQYRLHLPRRAMHPDDRKALDRLIQLTEAKKLRDRPKPRRRPSDERPA